MQLNKTFGKLADEFGPQVPWIKLCTSEVFHQKSGMLDLYAKCFSAIMFYMKNLRVYCIVLFI